MGKAPPRAGAASEGQACARRLPPSVLSGAARCDSEMKIKRLGGLLSSLRAGQP